MKRRNYRCNNCGAKFRSTLAVQQYFGQVDDSGYLLVGVGICPDCYNSVRGESFKRVFEQNLENAINGGFENPTTITKLIEEDGYERERDS